jgi:hypothetical protein
LRLRGKLAETRFLFQSPLLLLRREVAVALHPLGKVLLMVLRARPRRGRRGHSLLRRSKNRVHPLRTCLTWIQDSQRHPGEERQGKQQAGCTGRAHHKCLNQEKVGAGYACLQLDSVFSHSRAI